jgi:hypothetical protein
VSPELRSKIKELLLSVDYEALIQFVSSRKGALSHLISLTYDRGDIICWRAIEAVGRLSGAMRMKESKDVLERVIWMLKDETGGTWSAPDLAGEIILNNIDRFEHYIPVLAGFHQEDMYRAGILRALSRLAGAAYEHVLPYRELAFIYLHHKEAASRGNALLVLKGLKDDTYAPAVRKLLSDYEEFTYYNGENLVTLTIAQAAREALEAIEAS